MPKYNPFHNASDDFSDKRDYSETICGSLEFSFVFSLAADDDNSSLLNVIINRILTSTSPVGYSLVL